MTTSTSWSWKKWLHLFSVLLLVFALCMPEASILSNIVPVVAFNATVSKLNKAGAYNTVQAALNAAPVHSSSKYIIHVEAGVYVERLEVSESLRNIILVGDGAQQTVVQWNRHAPQYHTWETATLTVNGDGFNAMHMTFENTAGPGFQAMAVMTSSPRAAYYKCVFLGYQDTLCSYKGQHFYKECDIYGITDFIFGAAAAVFQSCNIYARHSQPVYFTAQNKDGGYPTIPSGFVIQDCKMMVARGVDGKFTAFLGRPWSNYSTVVVMESFLDIVIDPKGWDMWDNYTDTTLVTYVEFNNRGPGAATGGRVKWKGYQDATGHSDAVKRFTVRYFINAPEWLHATGIPYSSGFIYKY